MKIAILTLPLNYNYGGVLQAYALSKFLEQSGAKVQILNRRKGRNSSLEEFLVRAKWKLVSAIGKLPIRRYFKLTSLEKFKQTHFSAISPPTFNAQDLMKQCFADDVNAIIVGSDQVWNRDAAPAVEDFFLKFAMGEHRILKASYAASFAMDEWKFTSNETDLISDCLSSFHGVSIRESSASEMLLNKVGVNSMHHVDPTFLLDRSHYEMIASSSPKKASERFIFSYILDPSVAKLNLQKKISSKLGAPIREVYGNKFYFLSVEEWLYSIRESQFVVTDSFHGMVFAIIFQKPFLVIANHTRGYARFSSLLTKLGLEDRLVSNTETIDYQTIHADIEWNSVTSALAHWQEQSKGYLEEILQHGDG